MSIQLKQNETFIVAAGVAVTGAQTEAPFSVTGGARLLLTLHVLEIDPDTSVVFEVQNHYSKGGEFETLDTFTISDASRLKKVFSDFNMQFNVVVTVTGGNATYKVAAVVFDNASDVSIGDVTLTPGLPAGAATAAKQDTGNSSLAALETETTPYATRVDSSTTPGVLYVGTAATGASESDPVWRIKSVDTSSGVTVTWADGNSEFDNVWDDRATGVAYS